MDGARSDDSTSRSETHTHAALPANQTIEQQEAIFACNICVQTATCPVASTCSHLYCYECLFTWPQGRPRPCTMCRTDLTQGVNIIPIFTFHCAAEPPTEPLSSSNVSVIPQGPPPPPSDPMPRSIPLPSPVGVNAVGNNVTPTEEPRFVQQAVRQVPILVSRYYPYEDDERDQWY